MLYSSNLHFITKAMPINTIKNDNSVSVFNISWWIIDSVTCRAIRSFTAFPWDWRLHVTLVRKSPGITSVNTVHRQLLNL